ncbi:unnamed protein product, partial [Sphagnum compactum]
GCGLLLISTGISMAVPFGIGKVIDAVSDGNKQGRLSLILASLGGIFVFGFFINYGRVFTFRWMGEKITNTLRQRLFHKLMSQDMCFFNQNRTGDLLSRLSTDTSIMTKSVTSNVAEGLKFVLQGIFGSAMMYSISPELCLKMLGIIPPIAIIAAIYGRYVKDLSFSTQNALAETSRFAEERLANIRLVKSWSHEFEESLTYSSKISKVLSLAYRDAVAAGSFYAVTGLSANIALLALLWISGGMVASNLISIGNLSSFLMYAVYAGTSISGLGSFYSELMKGSGAGHEVFKILESESRIHSGKIRIEDSDGIQIVFSNVSFGYRKGVDDETISNISLTIPRRKVIAVVGASGSGKSTLVSLLLRLYDPDSGRIEIGKENICLTDIDIKWWHEQIGIVPQEPVLFSGSIRENVTYGLEDVKEEHIIEALKFVNAFEFVKKLPEGLDTSVGERGMALSGGQRQLIALVRAFIRNPQILIFDEAMSALDARNESLVREAIWKMAQGRTVIIIAHNLSTIRDADLIYVLDHGKIVEHGSFDELTASDGVFVKCMKYRASQ